MCRPCSIYKGLGAYEHKQPNGWGSGAPVRAQAAGPYVSMSGPEASPELQPHAATHLLERLIGHLLGAQIP